MTKRKPIEWLYGIKTVNADMTSLHDPQFKWERKGLVTCPDWKPTKECGNGLHWLGREQNYPGQWNRSAEAVLLVLKARKDESIDLGGKHKSKRCWVVFAGRVEEASLFLRNNVPGFWYGSTNTGGDGSTNTGGDYSTNIGGDRSTNTGGYDSTNIGGDRSTNIGGDYSTNSGGDGSTNTGGYGSKNTGGYGSKNTGGDRSTNTGGHGSKNTGGYGSKNSGGHGSTNTGGYGSTNTGGDGSTNTGGDDSILRWDLHDRMIVARVGRGGILPNVPYICVNDKVVRKE